MISWQLNPYSLSLFFTAILSLIMAIFIWQRRQATGATPLTFLMIATTIWSAGYAMELGSATLEAKYFWAKIQYFGIPFIPTLVLLLVLQHTDRKGWFTRRNFILLLIEPIAIMLLFWTNKTHRLIWGTWELFGSDTIPTLEINYGVGYWVHVIYAYLILLLSTGLLIQVFRQAKKTYRQQTGIILAATLIPWIGNIIYLLKLNPFHNLDLTPFAFVLTGIFIALGLFRFELFTLSPMSLAALIDPPPTLLTEEDRRRARFLAAILAVIIPLLFIPELIRAISKPQILVYFGPALVLVILAYIFSRTRFYKIGAWITLLVFALLPIAGILANPNFDPAHLLNTLIWMIMPLILGSLLLTPGDLLMFFIATTGMIVSLLAFVPTISFANLITPISINLAATILLLATAGIRLRDLRQLEESKERIADSNKFLNEVINSLSSPFYVINVDDYSIEMANEAARDLGIVEKGLCYALTHRFDAPCGGEGFCPLFMVQKTKEQFMVEHTHYKADNTPYYVEVHGYPVFDDDGNVVKMIEYSIDITGRKKADEEIRKLSQAIEQSASTIVITDVKGDIEYANPAFTRVTGYSIEEVLGQNPRVLKSGKMPPEVYKEMWTKLIHGEVWVGELINKKKNGELYWEFASIAPVKNQTGEITHFVAVKDDITQRKKMEDALVVARDRAHEANRLKSQILANVSHDMRTPLGMIVGYADMLYSGVYGSVNEAQKKELSQILRGGKQLAGFISNLLDHSEIASGELIFNKRKIAFHELVKEIEPSISLSAKEKGLEFSIEIADNVPEQLLGDYYWLQRILTNLAGNAVKFTEQGSVNIRIFLPDKHHLALQVSDTGPGISVEAQKHIFEAFRKGDKITSTRSSGSGLGLSIVKELTRLMDGEIKLDSEIGKGAIFTIVFPLDLPKE